ncbi:Crp/Fnr family transcriptional regulator [Methylocystis hirsuta]|uniref:Crp/Fnr family transcriptional regulator n=2 Tax=Methylocystis hirsuta TaxID=369798 RepID=A0A3M9XIV8_9HYPH|nr:Crp/Fnr family transcriptional regulator [Methylocystis hirsuta]
MMAIMSVELISQLRNFAGREMTFEPGQYLFRLGDKVRVVYFIEEGSVHLVRHQADGSALILERAASGSILAEASLYSDVYYCDAIATALTRILAVPKREIRARLATSPGFSEAWTKYLAHEVQRARLHAEILSLRTIAERLDTWIAWHDGHVPEKGEWKSVAQQIGVSPEALYRELAKRRSN